MKARWLLLLLILLAATYLDATERAAQTAPLECESTDGFGYPVDMSGYVK